MKTLVLVVENEGDTINYDHADWAEAKFEVSGEKPVTISAPHEEKVVLTPKPPATPRINGAKVFGVRPGHPFLFTIAATGERPMEFGADGLPAGLTLDRDNRPHHRRFASSAASTSVKLTPSNALGQAQREAPDRLSATRSP